MKEMQGMKEMQEIRNHIAYELLETEYDRVCLDYVILRCEGRYDGVESHKRAVIEAFAILNRRFEEYDYSVCISPDAMTAERISIEELLTPPPAEYHRGGQKQARSYTVQAQLPYWYAFIEPPQGTPYTAEDFIEFNRRLFPETDRLEAYSWNNDFSDYFDAGKEWWGTGMWTVYNESAGTITVIAASLTD